MIEVWRCTSIRARLEYFGAGGNTKTQKIEKTKDRKAAEWNNGICYSISIYRHWCNFVIFFWDHILLFQKAMSLFK